MIANQRDEGQTGVVNVLARQDFQGVARSGAHFKTLERLVPQRPALTRSARTVFWDSRRSLPRGGLQMRPN